MALDPSDGTYGGFVPKANVKVPPKRNPPPKRVGTPVRHAPAPPPRSNGGGGYVSPTYSAPSGGSSGPTAQIKPPKPQMSLADWLKKDSDYQDQLRSFSKTWADFLADAKVRQGRVGMDYETGKKSMADQRLKDLTSFKDDFASRGMLQSGLYAQRLGDYEKDYQTNLQGLSTQNNRLLQDIATEQANFKREQELAKEKARKDAANRRSSSY